VRPRQIAGEGDERFLGALREECQHTHLRGVEFVEAGDDEQARLTAQVRMLVEFDGGQPALTFGIGPTSVLQPVLISGIDQREFFETRAKSDYVAEKCAGMHARAFEFFQRVAEQDDEAGLCPQGGIVRQLIGLAQLIDDQAQQPHLNGISQTGEGLTGAREEFGIQQVERVQVYAERATRLGETAAKPGHLCLVGQDHGDRRERIGCLDRAQAFDGGVRFAGTGGGDEELGRHDSWTLINADSVCLPNSQPKLCHDGIMIGSLENGHRLTNYPTVYQM
jgi:hypothetical protein